MSRGIDKKKIQHITGDYDAFLHQQLQDKEQACAHLQVALDAYQLDHDKEGLLLALKAVAQAQGGIGALAKKTQLNREHLYYLLSGKGNPQLDTLTLIFKAFGLRLHLSVDKKD